MLPATTVAGRNSTAPAPPCPFCRFHASRSKIPLLPNILFPHEEIAGPAGRRSRQNRSAVCPALRGTRRNYSDRVFRRQSGFRRSAAVGSGLLERCVEQKRSEEHTSEL